MSRPTEATAPTAKLQLPRRGSWAGAWGFHADDREPLLHDDDDDNYFAFCTSDIVG